MKNLGGLIACGLLLAIGLAGCSQDGTPSVPPEAAADAAAGKKANYAAEKTKAGPRSPLIAD